MTKHMYFIFFYRFSIFGKPDGWNLIIFIDFNDLDDPMVGFEHFCGFQRLGRPDEWILNIFIDCKNLVGPTAGF